MSAFSYTDWTVVCNGREEDGQFCRASGRTDEFELRAGTAADVRKILKARGWAVNVPDPAWEHLHQMGSRTRGRRLDFCPKHKPED